MWVCIRVSSVFQTLTSVLYRCPVMSHASTVDHASTLWAAIRVAASRVSLETSAKQVQRTCFDVKFVRFRFVFGEKSSRHRTLHMYT